jgi:hypothetical protein
MLQRSFFTSDLAALSTGDEFKAASMLYEATYGQSPSGSLPDDDRLLAFLSRSGSQWATVKGIALRGWIGCSDGKLYHPVTAEKVLSAWIGRLKQRLRSKAGGESKNHPDRAHRPDPVILSQLTDAIAYLERLAPDSREVAKWKAKSALGSANGSAAGSANGSANGAQQAVLEECQAEAEGKRKSPSQNGGEVLHLDTARGVA